MPAETPGSRAVVTILPHRPFSTADGRHILQEERNSHFRHAAVWSALPIVPKWAKKRVKRWSSPPHNRDNQKIHMDIGSKIELKRKRLDKSSSHPNTQAQTIILRPGEVSGSSRCCRILVQPRTQVQKSMERSIPTGSPSLETAPKRR